VTPQNTGLTVDQEVSGSTPDIGATTLQGSIRHSHRIYAVIAGLPEEHKRQLLGERFLTATHIL
jgi:hypothetical protein